MLHSISLYSTFHTVIYRAQFSLYSTFDVPGKHVEYVDITGRNNEMGWSRTWSFTCIYIVLFLWLTISAQVRFHQRRLVSHKNKLEKANIAKCRSQYNVNTRERSRSPLRNTVNTDVDRIDKIENQLSELKDLIRSYPRRQNSLQTDRDLSIYTLFILPPARC